MASWLRDNVTHHTFTPHRPRARAAIAIVAGAAIVVTLACAWSAAATPSPTSTTNVAAAPALPLAAVQPTLIPPVVRSAQPRALNLKPPNGYVFNGGGVTSATGPIQLGSNCTITGVNFTGGGSAIQIRGSHNVIRNCTFGAYSWASLLVIIGSDNVIDGNTFNGVTGFGGNIQILGGKRNHVTGNVVHGGITSIAFLYSRSCNGGGRASLIEGNVVSGNRCSGASEEGITFDTMGNRPADSAAFEYDRIRRVSGSTVTLSPVAFRRRYVGYDMVFLSGSLRGHTRRIVKQTGSRFVLDARVPRGVAHSSVVIGATFKRNQVTGNTVVSAGTVGILLYGMAFGNTIQANVVDRGGIKVESIDNLVAADGSATRTYGRAPSGYNTVKGNTVSQGNISLEYYAIPNIDGHANTYSPYVSVGNNVIDNTCPEVSANHQVCYLARNTGRRSLSKVTLSPTMMVP
jgi:hypothetical protein